MKPLRLRWLMAGANVIVLSVIILSSTFKTEGNIISSSAVAAYHPMPYIELPMLTYPEKLPDDYKPKPKMSGIKYGPGPNLSADNLLRQGVNRQLVEAIFEGAKIAFGDPNDPLTRYVVQPQGGMRPGAMLHSVGRAVDLQIFDRLTGKFVGGTHDIMDNAYDNPHTYRTYEVLAQGSYKYLHTKYGVNVANQLSSGLYFTAIQGKRKGGLGVDNMHMSLGEGQGLGRIYTGANPFVQGWLKKHNAQPSVPMGNVAQWKSPLKREKDLDMIEIVTLPLRLVFAPFDVMASR